MLYEVKGRIIIQMCIPNYQIFPWSFMSEQTKQCLIVFEQDIIKDELMPHLIQINPLVSDQTEILGIADSDSMLLDIFNRRFRLK